MVEGRRRGTGRLDRLRRRGQNARRAVLLPTGGPSIARGRGPLPPSSASTSPACGPWPSIGTRGGSCTGASAASSATSLEGRGADERSARTMPACATCCWTPRSGGCSPSTRPARFRLWSLPEGTGLRTLSGSPPQRFTLPSFDRAGRRVAWASPDGAHVWDLEDPPDARPLRLPRGDVADFGETTFTRDGRWLATGSFGSAALLPDVASARPDAAGTPGGAARLRLHARLPAPRLVRQGRRPHLAIGTRGGCGTSHRAGGRLLLLRWAVDPKGDALVVVSPLLGVYSVPLGGGAPRKLLDFAHRRLAISATAFDERSRRLAVASHYGDPREEMLLYVLDSRARDRRHDPSP